MLTLYKCETPLSSKPGTQDFISSYGYKQLWLHMSKGGIMFLIYYPYHKLVKPRNG